jgi:hypothetical protein
MKIDRHVVAQQTGTQKMVRETGRKNGPISKQILHKMLHNSSVRLETAARGPGLRVEVGLTKEFADHHLAPSEPVTPFPYLHPAASAGGTLSLHGLAHIGA